MCTARQLRDEMRIRTTPTGNLHAGGARKVTNVIRNVFSRIGHVLETNLVDPKEQYQAVLLGDSLARHSHDGDYGIRGRIRAPHLVGEERSVSSLRKVA